MSVTNAARPTRMRPSVRRLMNQRKSRPNVGNLGEVVDDAELLISELWFDSILYAWAEVGGRRVVSKRPALSSFLGGGSAALRGPGIWKWEISGRALGPSNCASNCLCSLNTAK